MSGISSGVGIFSGINSRDIIDQLLSLEGRPKQAAQRRAVNLQLQQTVFLDFNSKLSAMRTTLKGFRENKLFRTTRAASSNEAIVKATGSNTAVPGTYQFLVDRLVSTQQMLSRGFGDSTTSGVGATEITLESAQARLDRDVPLADLRGGSGVVRGRIVITDSGNRAATIDLSRAGTIGEVVDAINNNGTAQVRARIVDDHLVLTDNAGANFSVADAAGSTTATSLGIVGSGASTITGQQIMTLTSGSLLSTLNDGTGVFIAPHSTNADFDFTLNVNIGGTGTNVRVNIGDVWEQPSGSSTFTKVKSAVTTVGGVVQRINEALTAAGATTVSAAISSDGKRLQIVDTAANAVTVTDNTGGTAAALGITGVGGGGTLAGRRIMAGMGTTLASSTNGGSGIGGDGKVFITTRDGNVVMAIVDPDSSLAEIGKALEDAAGMIGSTKRLTVSLNAQGTGLQIADNTGGAGNLFLTGNSGADTAASLGISTGAAGVASASVTGTNLQRRYLSTSTLVSSLNNGKGIGTGTFSIRDSLGATATIDIGSDTRNLGDLINEINGTDLRVEASLNSTGDGILLTETIPSGGVAGGVKIKVEDRTGTVARNLNLAGEASAVGAENTINGTYERKIAFLATDTLTQITTKINAANAGVTASIVNDGSGTAPFRLNLVASASGAAGRYLVNTGGFDFGLATTQTGQDARVFFGSADAANALLLSSSTNSLDNAISGVKVDLIATNASPATVTISRDTTAIEDQLTDFVKAFNELTARVGNQTSYDIESKRAGPLLGDSTALALRQALYTTIQSRAEGVSSQYARLTDIGFKVGTGGVLELNKDKLRGAIANDPEGVEQLLLARVQSSTTTRDLGGGVTVVDPDATVTFSSLGVLGQMEELATRYVDSVKGIIVGKTKSIEEQIKSQTRAIEQIDKRLASRRAVLEKQFLRMERSIGRLQGQSSSLQSISSLR